METIKFMKGDIKGAGGSRQGEIVASFSDLQWMFGEPSFEGIGDKITTEFCIDYTTVDKWGESTRGNFRLYDWYFSRDLNDSSKETRWNVGGTSIEDYFMFNEAKKQFSDTDLKYGDSEACLLECELVAC